MDTSEYPSPPHGTGLRGGTVWPASCVSQNCLCASFARTSWSPATSTSHHSLCCSVGRPASYAASSAANNARRCNHMHSSTHTPSALKGSGKRRFWPSEKPATSRMALFLEEFLFKEMSDVLVTLILAFWPRRYSFLGLSAAMHARPFQTRSIGFRVIMGL